MPQSPLIEQFVLADSALFGGRYAQALTTAFVRRGLLPVRSLAAPAAVSAASPARAAAAAARFAAVAAGGTKASGAATAAAEKPVRIALDGAALGLPVTTLYVEARCRLHRSSRRQLSPHARTTTGPRISALSVRERWWCGAVCRGATLAAVNALVAPSHPACNDTSSRQRRSVLRASGASALIARDPESGFGSKPRVEREQGHGKLLRV